MQEQTTIISLDEEQTSQLVSKWYVAPGCQPVEVQVQLTLDFAWFPAMYCALPMSQLFDDEKAAFEFAITQKRHAREMIEREYDALCDRRDKLEEIEDEKWERENRN